MKITGIIAEYNPFHKGHKYHLDMARKKTGADYLIIVMSGSFVQRGEPAVIDKWTRAKMALLNGADIVLELPVLFACASAEYFAKGAIKTLLNCGCIDNLSFGCESGGLEDLKKAAKMLSNETDSFKSILKTQLSYGMPYPSARAYALKQTVHLKNPSILDYPNNILGIEYLKALFLYHSAINPTTILRQGGQYHCNDITQEMASASAIRNALKQNHMDCVLNQIPHNCHFIFSNEFLKGKGPVFMESFAPFLHFCLRTMPLYEIKNILDVAEGIENRIQKCLYKNYEIEDMIHYIKTKRYTFTKIQRILLHIILNIKQNDMASFITKEPLPYLRVLGFRRQSQALLGHLKKNALSPLLTNLKHAEGQLCKKGMELLQMECRATDIYFLGCPNTSLQRPNQDFTTPLSIVD